MGNETSVTKSPVFVSIHLKSKPCRPESPEVEAPGRTQEIVMTHENTHVTLSSDNFGEKVLRSELPVLVDFWAEWCGPCRAVGPIVEELASEFDGKVTIGKVNVDEPPEIAAQYGIRGIPTLILFRGGRPVDQVVGAVPKPVLSDLLERHTADIAV